MRLGRQGGSRGARRRVGPRCPGPRSAISTGRPSPGGDAAAELVALVAGQDVVEEDDGVFRMVRKVRQGSGDLDRRSRGPPRPQSQNRHFDGYKAHLSVDPDSELIDEMAVTPANTPDATPRRPPRGPRRRRGEARILGDSAYADGPTRAPWPRRLRGHGEVPPMRNATGLFTKDRFRVDLEAQSVTCPAGQQVAINPTHDGGGRASFKVHCKGCPLRRACTKSRAGRTIAIGRHEDLLQVARYKQRAPEWQARYRADRPKVERKISHFARRAWGGRNARVRGRQRIRTDIAIPGPVPSTGLDWPCSGSIMTVRDGAWRGCRGPLSTPGPRSGASFPPRLSG